VNFVVRIILHHGKGITGSLPHFIYRELPDKMEVNDVTFQQP
jgi:hypothetical protein